MQLAFQLFQKSIFREAKLPLRRLLLGKKKQNKTTVFSVHHSEGTAEKAARGVPRNLRFVVFCWDSLELSHHYPRTLQHSPALSWDTPKIPRGLLPESSGDPLPGRPAKGFVPGRATSYGPPSATAEHLVLCPWVSVIFWQKRPWGIVWCVYVSRRRRLTDRSPFWTMNALPPCWCDPTLLKVTVPIQLVFHRFF